LIPHDIPPEVLGRDSWLQSVIEAACIFLYVPFYNRTTTGGCQ
jgi:hypothetical protein